MAVPDDRQLCSRTLTNVTFIDCTIISVLLDSADAAHQHGRDYQLANAPGMVHRVLDVLGLSG